MKLVRHTSFLFAVLALGVNAVACDALLGVDFSNAHEAKSSGPNDAGASNEPSSNNDGGSALSSLTGSWDLTGSRPGLPGKSGTLDIGPNLFKVTFGTSSLAYVATGDKLDVRFVSGAKTNVIQTVHTPSALFFGAIPVAIGGDWTFSDPAAPDHRCALSVKTSESAFDCTEVPRGWPEVVPPPRPGARYVLTHTQTSPSSFGDLGGTWSAALSTGGATCTISFAGDTVAGSCPSSVGALVGSFSATFTPTIVSGRLSDGVEFAGRKR